MGDYAKAIETYKKLVADEDSKVMVLQRLIQLLIQQRRFSEALEYLQVAVDSGYGGQEMMRKIGLIHLELEQFDQAIKVFSTMLEKDPAAQQIRLYLGMAYEEKGDLDSASQEHGIRAIPPRMSMPSATSLSSSRKRHSRRDEVLKTAIADNPRQIELYLNLSTLYEALDRPGEGLDLLLVAENRFKKDARLQFRIGVLYDKLGKRPESIERMKNVLAINPRDAQALNFIGYTYAEMGINLEEALGYLKKAVEIRPTTDLSWTASAGCISSSKSTMMRPASSRMPLRWCPTIRRLPSIWEMCTGPPRVQESAGPLQEGPRDRT